MVEDVQIGIAQCDITPEDPIWLVGYGDRNRKSEGIYQRASINVYALVQFIFVALNKLL